MRGSTILRPRAATTRSSCTSASSCTLGCGRESRLGELRLGGERLPLVCVGSRYPHALCCALVVGPREHHHHHHQRHAAYPEGFPRGYGGARAPPTMS